MYGARPMTLRRSTTVVVVAGCLIAVVTYGMRASLGLFTQPLSDLRGWDRETFAFAIAIQDLLWGIGQPFAGAIADRYGSGRVLAGGGLLYKAGGVLMASSTSGAALTLSGGVLLGLGLSGASFLVVIAAFSRLVPPDRRSWAIGPGDRRRLARPVPVRAARPGVPVGVRGGHRARAAVRRRHGAAVA